MFWGVRSRNVSTGQHAQRARVARPQRERAPQRELGPDEVARALPRGAEVRVVVRLAWREARGLRVRGDGPGVVGCAVVGAGDGADVVGRGVGFGVGPGVGAVDGAGDGGKPTTTSASAAIVEAAKSVRCVHSHVTPDAVEAMTLQPSEDQPRVASSQNEHAAVLAGQVTVTSSGMPSPEVAGASKVIVDPSGSITSRDSPQSKVVGTSQSKCRTWD